MQSRACQHPTTTARARCLVTRATLANRLHVMPCIHREWVEGVEARAQATQYRLESELAGYKTNLIKESIRMGHHELADFFYERGDLQARPRQGSPLSLSSCWQALTDAETCR